MKNFIYSVLLISSCIFYGCQIADNEEIVPKTSILSTTAESRNLRPAIGEKPDLKVFPFFVSGAVTLVSGSYKIPISFKELNIGTATTGYGSDTLKVYQKIPTAITGFYSYRQLQSFVRTATIPVGGSWYLNAVVNFPTKWRPSSGKINLIIVADGSNTIAELDETNNVSDTIWNIYLP